MPQLFWKRAYRKCVPVEVNQHSKLIDEYEPLVTLNVLVCQTEAVAMELVFSGLVNGEDMLGQQLPLSSCSQYAPCSPQSQLGT